MTIYFIVRGLPDKKSPQWGCFEFDQAKSLAKMGHKVVYISVDRRFRLYWRKIGFSKHIKDGIITYNSFILPSSVAKFFGNKLAHKLRIWQTEKMFLRAIKEEGKPDILYSHYLFVTSEAVELEQKYHVPLVAIEHWSEINKSTLLPKVQKMGESVYAKVSKLLTVSHALQKSIKKYFDVDSTVVYNMVGDNFHYMPRKHNDDLVRFVATGSLIHRKGFDLLIDAFDKLKLPQDKWELNIIGAGKEFHRLKKQIADHNLAQNIHLLGKQTATQIVEWMNKSDVFVLPSRMETFGVVYIEAMACGLPVIATPCGGPEEFVNQKNGILVPIDDVDALTKAIEYMYEHYPEYDRQFIADDCRARFSSEVIAKQLTSIFEEVVANYK